MRQKFTNFLLLAILLIQQGCHHMEPDFVEIIVIKETKEEQTIEFVCYLKRAELIEAGISEDEVRQSVLPLLNDVGDVVSKTLAEMVMPGDGGVNEQAGTSQRETVQENKRPKCEKMVPLFERGIFAEVRMVNEKQTKVISRGVIRGPSDRSQNVVQPKQ